MKKFIEKIKNLMANEPKAFVLLLILVLFLVIFILYRVADKYFNYETHETSNYYIYNGTDKISFKGDLTINKRNVITSLKSTNKKLNLEDKIVFSKNRIIFTGDMILVLKDNTYEFYKLPAYTYIENDYIITKDFKKKIEKYFVFNGNNLYLFKDSGVLSASSNKITLNEYTMVNAGSLNLVYYNYKDKKISEINSNTGLSYKNIYYKVNLNTDTIDDGIKLPNSTNHLNSIVNYK